MELLAFRVSNFRSIVDSGWVEFSRDRVTVLVGQNESGKTSLLQAMYCALGGAAVTPDDRRIDAAAPNFFVRAKIGIEEISVELDTYEKSSASALKKYLKSVDNTVELLINRIAKPDAVALTELVVNLVEPSTFEELLHSLTSSDKSPEGNQPTSEEATATAEPSTSIEEGKALEKLNAVTLAELIYYSLPRATLFNAESGLLPNTIDIDDKGKPTGSGLIATTNFLTIAEIDLQSLVKGDGRYRQNILNKANQRLSDDFAGFWSQVIGSKSRLTLQCAFEIYSSSAGEKVGKPYLEFWISDGNTQLYPKQRSQGVRWFVSFYLQLRATEKTKAPRWFLLDEPGANLHDKAQEDVLKLIDRLRSDIPIVYSTHSPKMIEYEKIFRIRAVQRDGAQEDSPTVVIDGQHLGAASSDTLSPLLSAMGSDMSQQAVIKKRRNVLLEEISGYYYLKSFWKLLGRKEEAYFIASTGVNKLPLLANMFLGWGLDFIVAVDDDRQGRDVFNQLKKDLGRDDDDYSKTFLLKFPGCTAIEEAFSNADFKKHVLRDPIAEVPGTNADYMKAAHLSKPVTALEFMLAVDNKQIVIEDFDSITRDRIKAIADAVCTVLDARNARQ